MVGALVRILTAVVFLFFTFFLDKTYVFRQVLVLRVLGLGSRLQEVRPTIPARGVWGAKPPLSALFIPSIPVTLGFSCKGFGFRQ